MVMMEDCWLTGPVGSGDRLVLPHAASSVATCNVQTNDAIVKFVLTFLQRGGLISRTAPPTMRWNV